MKLIKNHYMANKKTSRESDNSKKPVSNDSGKKSNPEFETMSQRQNRYGKGRQKNGSDGSSTEGRGSNH